VVDELVVVVEVVEVVVLVSHRRCVSFVTRPEAVDPSLMLTINLPVVLSYDATVFTAAAEVDVDVVVVVLVDNVVVAVLLPWRGVCLRT
jgi:hypothetical protein